MTSKKIFLLLIISIMILVSCVSALTSTGSVTFNTNSGAGGGFTNYVSMTNVSNIGIIDTVVETPVSFYHASSGYGNFGGTFVYNYTYSAGHTISWMGTYTAQELYYASPYYDTYTFTFITTYFSNTITTNGVSTSGAFTSLTNWPWGSGAGYGVSQPAVSYTGAWNLSNVYFASSNGYPPGGFTSGGTAAQTTTYDKFSANSTIPYPSFGLSVSPTSGTVNTTYNMTLTENNPTGNPLLNLTYQYNQGANNFNTISGYPADFANISGQWEQNNGNGVYNIPVTAAAALSPLVSFGANNTFTGNITCNCLVNVNEGGTTQVNFNPVCYINLQLSGGIAVQVSVVDSITGAYVQNAQINESNIYNGNYLTTGFYVVTTSSPYIFTVYGTNGNLLIPQGAYMNYNVTASGYTPNYLGQYITTTQNSYYITIPMVQNNYTPLSNQMALIVQATDSISGTPLNSGTISLTDRTIQGKTQTQNMSSGGTVFFQNLTPLDSLQIIGQQNGYSTYTTTMTYAANCAGTTQWLNLPMTQSGISPPAWVTTQNGTSLIISNTGAPSLQWILPNQWVNINTGSLTNGTSQWPLPPVNTTVNQTLNVNIVYSPPTVFALPLLPTTLPPLPFNSTNMYNGVKTVLPEALPYCDLWNNIFAVFNSVAAMLIIVVLWPLVMIIEIYTFTVGLTLGFINGFFYAVYPFTYTVGLIFGSFPQKFINYTTLSLSVILMFQCWRVFKTGGRI